jgi:transcriptional regulator with PAS, ATPase and Fis domain
MIINCVAIPENLLESELFGYEKGAFTGADQAKKGRIALANHGTVFLDEIADMKLSLQSKILRVLQEQEIEPVGAASPMSVNVRVIAATHTNLDQAVQENRFRQDLYYRLSVVPLTIPPLRERPEDIPALVNTFIMMYNRGVKFGVQRFSAQAMQALQTYPWPGNVRELENLVQRMCILHYEHTVQSGDLPPKYRGFRRSDQPSSITSSTQNMGSLDFYSRMSELEDQLILHALRRSKGNKKMAAQILNMKRTTLLEKIKKKKLGPVLEEMLKKNASTQGNCQPG